jgi:phosphopantothenoylcysteine decarboxylase/phosphopantothenate--cysteine ligase
VRLAPNPDIAAEIGAAKQPGQQLVVFAAETDDGPARAQAKLVKKRADFVVLNDVSEGKVFGADTTEVLIIADDGATVALSETTKTAVAHAVWDLVAARWGVAASGGR